MAQIKESWLVENGVYTHCPILGICAKCFKIGALLIECMMCKVMVHPIASIKHNGTPSFFVNPGFLSYNLRGKNRDEEDKYNDK